MLYIRKRKICSPEFSADELNNIKKILKLNGYPETLANRIISLQLIQSNKTKPYGPEKCPILLKVPYIKPDYKLIEKRIVDIKTRLYFSVNPRAYFTSKPILQRS